MLTSYSDIIIAYTHAHTYTHIDAHSHTYAHYKYSPFFRSSKYPSLGLLPASVSDDTNLMTKVYGLKDICLV